jgi:hypothetical protein
VGAAPRIRYEFVTTDGRFLGDQEWRGRHWQVGDTISTPGPDRSVALWVAVDVSGTRVTFARRGKRHSRTWAKLSRDPGG